MNTDHSTIKIPPGGDSTAAKESAVSRIAIRAEGAMGDGRDLLILKRLGGFEGLTKSQLEGVYRNLGLRPYQAVERMAAAAEADRLACVVEYLPKQTGLLVDLAQRLRSWGNLNAVKALLRYPEMRRLEIAMAAFELSGFQDPNRSHIRAAAARILGRGQADPCDERTEARHSEIATLKSIQQHIAKNGKNSDFVAVKEAVKRVVTSKIIRRSSKLEKALQRAPQLPTSENPPAVPESAGTPQ